MKTWGFDVTGCEVDPIAVDRAKAKGVHVLQGDFSELDFQEGYYDVVVMNHVLEHFHDCKAVLRKVRRILKDRGRLILVVPNATALSRVVFEKHWFNWEIPRHLYHFTPETLEKYCSVVGFKKLSIESRSHVSIWLDSVRYKMGIKPMEYKEFLNLRKKFVKVYNSFGAFLNHHNLGDHIAGCFEKV